MFINFKSDKFLVTDRSAFHQQKSFKSMKNPTTWLLIGAMALGSTTAWAQSIVMGALVSGQVSQVFVKEGQTVKVGEKLLNIDATRYQATLRLLQAQLDLQQARYADAKIELETELDLFDRTVTSRRTLDAAKLAFKVVEAELATAKAKLAAHQAWQKYVYLTAPIKGKVTKIYASKGSTVFEENQPIIELKAIQ